MNLKPDLTGYFQTKEQKEAERVSTLTKQLNNSPSAKKIGKLGNKTKLVITKSLV